MSTVSTIGALPLAARAINKLHADNRDYLVPTSCVVLERSHSAGRGCARRTARERHGQGAFPAAIPPMNATMPF